MGVEGCLAFVGLAWLAETLLDVRASVQRELFIENLLVGIHCIIVMIRWTGLAPWEFEFLFGGRLTSGIPQSNC